MNYQRVYDQIVSKAKTRTLTGYRERHHITPKCMGGSNDPDNLVELTAREHYICHWLLIRIYPENSKLVHAFWMMNNALREGRRYKISARTYEEARIQHSNAMLGDRNPNKQEVNRLKISQTMRAKGLRPPSAKGRVLPQEARAQISLRFKGVKHSEERRKKNSESHKGLQQGCNNGMWKTVDVDSFKLDVLNNLSLAEIYSRHNLNQTAFYSKLEQVFNTRKLRDIRQLTKWSCK